MGKKFIGIYYARESFRSNVNIARTILFFLWGKTRAELPLFTFTCQLFCCLEASSVSFEHKHAMILQLLVMHYNFTICFIEGSFFYKEWHTGSNSVEKSRNLQGDERMEMMGNIGIFQKNISESC